MYNHQTLETIKANSGFETRGICEPSLRDERDDLEHVSLCLSVCASHEADTCEPMQVVRDFMHEFQLLGQDLCDFVFW